MPQGRRLTKGDAKEIESLVSRGWTEEQIKEATGFARCTIRKVKHKHIRQFEEDFQKSYHVTRDEGERYISSVTDEVLYIQKNPEGYWRILGGKHDRMLLHTYEAKALYELLELEWPSESQVHHIDGLRDNPNLNNLAVFSSCSEHIKFHGDIALAMYDFLFINGLLPDFYKEYPHLKLESLESLVITIVRNLKESDKIKE